MSETKQLWIVGLTVGKSWGLIGLFDDRQLAVDACRDETYFIGHAPTLNEPLAHDRQEWPGHEFPLRGVAEVDPRELEPC